MKLKDNYSEENLISVVGRLREAFEDEESFVFIYTGKDKKITDIYHNTSADVVCDSVGCAIQSAVENKLLKGGDEIMAKKESKIKDIIDGKGIDVWQDDDFVTISIGMTTVAVDVDHWEAIKQDFEKLLSL